jgi:hypothetical protein
VLPLQIVFTKVSGLYKVITGFCTIVNVAPLLESIPQVLVKNNLYWLLFSAFVTPVNVRVLLDVPEYIPVLLRLFHVAPPLVDSYHCIVIGAKPVTVVVKLIVLFAQIFN